MNSQALHPAHLADLQKSGLTDETIRAAGIYTVPPGEIGKKLGGAGNSVVSALGIPYRDCGGYERFKVWRDDDKAGPKYLVGAGSTNRLYVPPTCDLAGDDVLLLTEGEKKVLAMWQAGYQVVGISGVFNWLSSDGSGKTRPIPDLALVTWRRLVIIVFDSDAHSNPMVRLAAWRLARELAGRGATVSVLFLPHGPNGQKQGADDYLAAHGPEDLADLLKTAWPYDPALNDHEADVWWHLRGITPKSPTFDKLKALSNLVPTLTRMSNLEVAALLEELRERLKLRAGDLSELKSGIKAARKAQESNGKKVKGKTLDVKDLEEGFRLHPAIDFLGEAMTIGFRVSLTDNETGLLLIISDGQGVRAEVNPETVEIGERVYQVMGNTVPPFVQDVWNLDRLKAFLEHPTRPQELYKVLVGAFKKYLDLPEPAYGLLAAWAVGTYFAHLFTAFPFLHFLGPKESGKSKSLEALRYACLNAWKGRDITPAALGDATDGQRGTLLLDQAEKVNNDKESANLIGLLADSYKKAGGQRRVLDTSGKTRKVLEFSTYGPKAFASTKNIDPDLRDRCIKIPMTRTRRRLPDLEGWEPVWKELKDKLYRFTLASFKNVRQHYEANPGDGTRIGELWRPLLAVLLTLEAEGGEVEAIRTLFMEAAQEGRHEPTGWECTLLEVLREESQTHQNKFEMAVSEILKAMNIEGDKKPSNKWIGDTLSRYHLHQSHRRVNVKVEGKKSKETAYQFDPARVKELCEIYLRDTPPDDLSHLSPGDNTNDSNVFEVTRENQGTRPYLSLMSPVFSGEDVDPLGGEL